MQRAPLQRISKHRRASLTLPVSRIYNQMKQSRIAARISTKSAIALTSVLEYMLVEILELAGTQCKADTRTGHTIKPRHILLAIKEDEELKGALRNILIPLS